MSLRTLPASAALLHLDDDLRELLDNPNLGPEDKAVILQMGNLLAPMRRRHLPKWTPCNPKTLPPRKPGQGYAPTPKGWMDSWEEEKEAANA